MINELFRTFNLPSLASEVYLSSIILESARYAGSFLPLQLFAAASPKFSNSANFCSMLFRWADFSGLVGICLVAIDDDAFVVEI